MIVALISRTIETRHIKWHETCKCKCRLDVSVNNNKQRLNNDKCRMNVMNVWMWSISW